MVEKVVNSLGNLPSWDLSAFFSGKGDPRIAEVLAETLARAERFEKTWRGTVTDASSGEDILAALQEYEAIIQEAQKPQHYAHLLQTADSTDAEHGALVQKTSAGFLDIYRHLVFFELELLQISPDTPHPNYRHFLANLLKTKPHRLSESEEQIMNDLSLTGPAAFTRLFDEELSQKKFMVAGEGGTEEWPEEKVLNLLYDSDRERRKAGADAMTRGLSADLRRFTFIFNTLGEDKHIRDRYQKFATPEASRHLFNEVTQEMVDTMSEAVHESRGVVADYYNLKREVLGLTELYDYDRYAPVLETQRLYAFDEAREMMLGAYGRFTPVMRDAAQEFFRESWIDAETRHGKRGGAFCSFGTPDTHPVVFLNYLGTVKHVMTLAHELGHGVHASLMRKQTMLNFDTPLTIAETASVFGEMLVFDSLRSTMTGRDLLALTMGKIEEIFATIFRQHAMYQFERDFHAARRSEGELKPERINEMWMNRQKEMFGDSVILRDDYRIWWSYIPHFLHTPFYVYAYVFGELLTLSFYDMYQKTADKAAFAEQYLAMLEAGGTKTPEELMEPFGIDLNRKEFWQGGLCVIQDLVKEAKQLYIIHNS